MKICDKCFHQNGDSVKAVAEVSFSKIHESYDLCQSCNELVREFINNPKIEKESFKCEACSFEGKSEQGLKVHMKAKHS